MKCEEFLSFHINFRYGGEAQMRFPSALPPPSNVGPILGSPVPAGK